MAVCSFLENSGFITEEVSIRAKKEIRRIVRENDEVDFWFYSTDELQTACMTHVLKIQQKNPDKKITISYVYEKNHDYENPPDIVVHAGEVMPRCFADRILTSPIETGDNNATVSQFRKHVRWIIEQSAYLICHVYPQLCFSEAGQYSFAKKTGKTKIIDITDKATSQTIQKNIKLLHKDERLVLEELNKGTARKDIAKMLNVSVGTVGNKVFNAEISLKKLMRESLSDSPRRTCGIANLGKARESTIKQFEITIRFLRKKYNVRDFYISRNWLTSPYRSVWETMQKKCDDIRLIVWTNLPDDQYEMLKELETAYCPPYDAIENYDTQSRYLRTEMLRSTKGLIEKMDFCIFNLERDDRFDKSIRSHMRKANKATVLDIGRGCEADRPDNDEPYDGDIRDHMYRFLR